MISLCPPKPACAPWLMRVCETGCSIVGTSRRMFTPGVFVGTMIIELPW